MHLDKREIVLVHRARRARTVHKTVTSAVNNSGELRSVEMAFKGRIRRRRNEMDEIA